MLIARPHLTEQAVKAGIDLLVVDEAQRLRRPPGHPGEPAWRAIAPIAALGRHVLLLSATPLEDDAHGFFRLLQLLRPQEFPEDMSFETRLAERHAAARLHELHAPRRHWRLAAARRHSDRSRSTPRAPSCEARSRPRCGSAPAANAVVARDKIDRVRRALASGAALGAVLGPDDPLRPQVAADGLGRRPHRVAGGAGAARGEPRRRRRWSSSRIARPWRCCAPRSATGRSWPPACFTRSCRRRAATPRSRASARSTVPACSSPPSAAARAATSSSAAAWCCSTCRGSRRWSNSALAVSIALAGAFRWRSSTSGRPAALAATSCGCSKSWGCSASRWPDSRRSWRTSKARSRRSRSIRMRRCPTSGFAALVAEAHTARTRIREAAYQQLHRDPYRAEMGPGILARVPEGARRAQPGGRWSPPPSAWASPSPIRADTASSRSSSAADRWSTACRVCRRDRVTSARSIARKPSRTKAIDFFASGHPLVEGIFAHYEESPLGRAVRFEITIGSRDRRRAGRHLQGRPGVRGRGARRHRPRPAGLGRSRLPATHSRPSRDRQGRRTRRAGAAWCADWAHTSTRPAVCTP